jgi:mono/diheme cytochrome c family protein
MIAWRHLFLLCAPTLFAAAAENAPASDRHPIAWDAVEKTVVAKPGDGAADFAFTANNTSNRAVTITAARPSCGCTVVELPATPWVLAPGASGVLKATVDFAGKDGFLTKSIAIESSEGAQTLFLRVDIPPPDETERLRNRALAGKNRQAIFLGACASCHVVPGIDKRGEALFAGVCGVCHVSSRRASMVPDLFTARDHRDAAWWRAWITDGKDGTLMPGFAEKNGGSLSTEQIDSLVEFALAKLPTEPRKN